MSAKKGITDTQFRDMVAGRSLYIWGCGHLGTTLFDSFCAKEIPVAGFIDSRIDDRIFRQKNVCKPDIFFTNKKNDAFIVITATLYEEEIKEQCRKEGLSELTDFVGITRLKPYHFEVDVAGTCNLQCLTCPRGNIEERYRDGMMSAETYRRVLDKILSEVPFLSDIQLYSWGEPLLNKDLPEMIRMTNKKGVSVAISSNLSLKHSLIDVVKARPHWFRISFSGYEDSYPVMHRGGDWELVKAQMENLSKLRDEYAPEMQVEMNYHMYKHNLADMDRVQKMSEELGFLFQPNYAFIDPLDILLEYKKGKPMPAKAEEALPNLLIDLDEGLRLAEERKESFCPCERNICITADLRIMNCPHLYSPEKNTLAEDFLEISMDEIIERLDDRSVCGECKSFSLNSFYSIYLEKKDLIKQ